jgi:cytosine/uracil/thiamine/allantoin permease
VDLDTDSSKVTPSLQIAVGARHLASLGYMYGFFISAGVYILLSRVFVARQTVVKTEHGGV